MACVTACPSGVQYDQLIEDTRAQVERSGAPRPGKGLRNAVFALFPHPGRLRALVPLMAGAAPRLGPLRLAAAGPARRARQAAPAHARATRCPRRRRQRRARGSVAFLQGCVQRVFFREVNRATVAVLAAEGYDVHAPRAPACCGSLQQHAGKGTTRPRGEGDDRRLRGLRAIVTNAAGCGSGMKEYGHLLRDDAE